MTTETKKLALQELAEIIDQLHELSDEACGIMESEFSSELESLRAYQGLSFGWSDNPYDETLEKVYADIERNLEGGQS